MTSRPNILMICSDQHSVRTLGCYGNETIATPNLDRLAGEGVRFDAAYCSCPLCAPSRMSFLTGKHPFHCDVLGNESIELLLKERHSLGNGLHVSPPPVSVCHLPILCHAWLLQLCTRTAT